MTYTFAAVPGGKHIIQRVLPGFSHKQQSETSGRRDSKTLTLKHRQTLSDDFFCLAESPGTFMFDNSIKAPSSVEGFVLVGFIKLYLTDTCQLS